MDKVGESQTNETNNYLSKRLAQNEKSAQTVMPKRFKCMSQTVVLLIV